MKFFYSRNDLYGQISFAGHLVVYYIFRWRVFSIIDQIDDNPTWHLTNSAWWPKPKFIVHQESIIHLLCSILSHLRVYLYEKWIAWMLLQDNALNGTRSKKSCNLYLLLYLGVNLVLLIRYYSFLIFPGEKPGACEEFTFIDSITFRWMLVGKRFLIELRKDEFSITRIRLVGNRAKILGQYLIYVWFWSIVLPNGVYMSWGSMRRKQWCKRWS